MTDQEKTIADIEQAMRTWIEKQIPLYEELEPDQLLTTTQGERSRKANPALQEIRAAFKDYCYIVKTQKELSNNENADAEQSIDYFRSRLKVI